MKPAKDSTIDYKRLVAKGYNVCADAYNAAREKEKQPELSLLTSRLKNGASVLDIGCGAGVPIAKILAERFAVTGVDISLEQINRAQKNVEKGRFIYGDIMNQHFESKTFDAVTIFYALFHLPREEHSELIKRIYRWLKPKGLLLATVTKLSDDSYTEDSFFGTTMFWSNFSLGDYQFLLQNTGFVLIESCEIGHSYQSSFETPFELHPLLLAQKSNNRG